MSRRTSNEIVVIAWRDIPAQVNGRMGEERHQVMLPRRFQTAIDRAAMRAGTKTAQEYVAEWRRSTSPLEGELVASVEAMAAELTDGFSHQRLQSFVNNGGWDPTTVQGAST